MKRKMTFLALTLALAGSLCACGSTTSAPDTENSPAVTPNVVARGNNTRSTGVRGMNVTDNEGGDYTAYGANNGIAQGVGDVGRGVVNGAGDMVEGVGNGIRSVGNGLQNAAQ